MSEPNLLSASAPPLDPLVADAAALARAAAAQSGLEVRVIDRVEELDAAGALLTYIWDRAAHGRTIGTSLLKALATSGHYVAGAFAGDRLVGAAVGFFAAPPTVLHSHIAGADPDAPVRGIGYALKLHQRAWALSRGATTITWTYDPLVRRNAHFNITKLGARATRYLPNYYGAMNDGRNAGEESDRLLVEWDIAAPEVPVEVATGQIVLDLGPDGRPLRRGWDGGPALLVVPADIEQMRAEDPTLAREWRLAVRDVLGGALDGGGAIAGFRQQQGYVIT
jgi:predicted GNAT superfamily acetyltransferase